MDSNAPNDHPPGDSRTIEQCAAEWLARREFNAWSDDDEAALQAHERRFSFRRRQQPVVQQVYAKHAVCVAADRILGHADDRAEHARLCGHRVRPCLDRKDEEAVRADVRREVNQLVHLRLQGVERVRRLQAKQQA